MAKSVKRAPKQQPAVSAKMPAKPGEDADTPVAFTQVPSSMTDFVQGLSMTDVYLVHIDRQPVSEKHQMFFFPLVLNGIIFALVIYRIYIGIFTYPEIFAALVNPNSPSSINTKNASWGFLSSTLARRTLTFLFDYLLITLFFPWPVRFFTGPISLRRKLGFKPAEVVVRKSREWSESLSQNWIKHDKKTISERIMPAITPMRLQRTGYLLIDADWDLDFRAMVRVHDAIKTGKASFKDFETCVIVHGGGNKGWLVWRVEDALGVRRRDEQHNNDSSSELSPSERDKIVAFKDKLASMGKEDLFFRWVEIIQFESTQPGGFTPERQQKAMQETKELFDKHGVDFEQFWTEVGGMKGVVA